MSSAYKDNNSPLLKKTIQIYSCYTNKSILGACRLTSYAILTTKRAPNPRCAQSYNKLISVGVEWCLRTGRRETMTTWRDHDWYTRAQNKSVHLGGQPLLQSTLGLQPEPLGVSEAILLLGYSSCIQAVASCRWVTGVLVLISYLGEVDMSTTEWYNTRSGLGY